MPLSKLFLSILFCAVSSLAFAQESLTLYTLGGRPSGYTSKVDHVRTLRLDAPLLARLRRQAPEELTLNLALPDGGVAVLQLTASKAVSPHQRVRQSGGQSVEADKGLHYRTAATKDEYAMQAALSLFDLGGGRFQLSGLIVTERTSYVLGPDAQGNAVIYPDAEMADHPVYDCHADEMSDAARDLGRNTRSQVAAAASSCAKSVKLFIEVDNQTYIDNGSNVARTVAWINTVWNVCATLYANINIPVEVVDTYINTRPDNYPSNTSTAALTAFMDTLGHRVHNGNLAHLISTKRTNLGGVGYVGSLGLPPYNSAFSNCNVTYNQLPAYSWTINVLTHEMGHNMGSRHTHWCGWELSPGVYGMIDSCVNQNIVGASGTCYTGPMRPRAGTIMSYCHLTGGGVNLNLGFGPLPTVAIQNGYQYGPLTPSTSSAPSITVVPLDTACPGESFTLSATAVANATYAWTGPNGFTSSQRQPVISSFTSAQAGTYAVTATLNGCASTAVTTQVVANCIAAGSLTTTSLCGGDGLSLRYASSFTPAAGNQYQVELSNASGTFATTPPVVGTLTSAQARSTIALTIPAGTAAGTGYKLRVRSTSPAHTGVAATTSLTVKPTAALPTAAGGSRNGTGTVTLTATPPTGASVAWYADSTSTTALATTNSFTTPSLSATRTYWVQSVGATVCSSGRVPVVATIILCSAPAAPAVAGTQACSGTDVSLTAAAAPSGFAYRWYDRANGGPVLANGQNPTYTFRAASTDTLYVALQSTTNTTCASARTAVVVNVTAIPAAPALPGKQACKDTDVLLTAPAAPSATAYRWYDRPVGGTVLPNGQSPTYAFRAIKPDTFYVALQSTANANCISARTRVLVDVTDVPEAPSVAGQNVCAGANVSLTAPAAPAATAYRWYDHASGGAVLANGQTGTYTLAATRTDTLYVALQSTVNANCASARTPVVVQVEAIPAPPTVPGKQACAGTRVSLNAAAAPSGQAYRWYDRPTGGAVLPNGQSASYSLQANQTDTLYVALLSLANTNCLSARSAVAVQVQAVPALPATVSDSACPGAQALLKATGAATGQQYVWYDRATGGNVVSTGLSELGWSASQQDTLYISLRQMAAPNCAGGRAPVYYLSRRVPASTQATPEARCGSGSLSLTATASALDTVHWLNSQGILLARGAVFHTPSLASTTTFQVRVKSSGGCLSLATSVLATVNAVPMQPSLSRQGARIQSSNTGHHRWFRNSVQTDDTGSSVEAPAIGVWRAITLTQTCESDTSNSIEVRTVTSVDDAQAPARPLLYPNPAERSLHLAHTEGYASYTITDMLGREKQAGTVVQAVDLSDLAPGIYVLKLQGRGRQAVAMRFEKR